MSSRKEKPGRKKIIKEKIYERDTSVDTDYINSLRQQIQDLKAQVEMQLDLINCLEKGERRLRVWAVVVNCASCGTDHTEYVALVNKKVYQASDYKKLVQRLRMMGYLVKETTFNEKPPVEGKPFDGECDFLKPDDIRNMKIPDGVPDGLLEEEDRNGRAS